MTTEKERVSHENVCVWGGGGEGGKLGRSNSPGREAFSFPTETRESRHVEEGFQGSRDLAQRFSTNGSRAKSGGLKAFLSG